MIGGLLDQMQPGASDEEDDERLDVKFVFSCGLGRVVAPAFSFAPPPRGAAAATPGGGGKAAGGGGGDAASAQLEAAAPPPCDFWRLPLPCGDLTDSDAEEGGGPSPGPTAVAATAPAPPVVASPGGPPPSAAAAAEDAAAAVAPESCRAVIVCSPGAATAFALSAFSLRPVPWLLDVARAGEDVRPFPMPPKPPRFFVAAGGSESVAVALLEGLVAAEHAQAWVDALLEGFSGVTEVLFLDRIHRTEWQSPNGLERPLEPHCCGLWTKAWAEASLPGFGAVGQLPTPNLVGGLGAALLTQCEVAQKRCLMALSVQDGVHLGEGCVRGFAALDPLLAHLGAVAAQGRPAVDYAAGLRHVVPPLSLSIYA